MADTFEEQLDFARNSYRHETLAEYRRRKAGPAAVEPDRPTQQLQQQLLDAIEQRLQTIERALEKRMLRTLGAVLKQLLCTSESNQ